MFPRNTATALLCAALFSTSVAQAQDDRPVPPGSMDQIRSAALSLPSQVTHLLEDIQIESRRVPDFRRMADDAGRVAESAEHLAASVDQGVDVKHITRDFQEFDAEWHRLFRQLQQTDRPVRHVQLAASRVSQLDSQLHRLLRVPAPVDRPEVRQLSEALAESAEHLQADTETDLGESARLAPVVRAIAEFAEAADHFRASVAEGVDMEHARRDFADVAEAWQQASNALYSPSLYRFEHLLEAASRVVPIVRQLVVALGTTPESLPVGRSTLDMTRPFFGSAPSRYGTDYGLTPRGSCCMPGPFGSCPPLEDDFGYDRFSRDYQPVEPDRTLPRGQLRVLPPSPPGRRFDPRPQRDDGDTPAPRDGIQPRNATPDGHSHDHGDGHSHSHASPAPTPATPKRASPPAAQSPSPRPAEIEADPAVSENLSKLSPADRAAAIAQRVCPVTGDLLGEMGMRIKVHVTDRDVFVCCKGCVAKVQKEPGKYLDQLKQP